MRAGELRMIVAGGGTGGHLFPGLAVAQTAAAAGATVSWIGSREGIESRVIPQTPFQLHTLPIRALRGRGWRGVLDLAWQLPVSVARAWYLLGRLRPDVVFGVGGYGSAPTILAAWLRRIPRVLLEQNAHPGMTNRWLARISQRVCTAFADAAAFFPPGRTVVTGTPVRNLATSAVAASQTGFTVLIFGGSQGAHHLNVAMTDAAATLHRQIPGLRLIHQTGMKDEAWVRERYAAIAVNAEVTSFIQDMSAAYARADLVICRSGTTTAEITTLGKPAILIPYPYAADDHQRANAEVLVRHGAAEMILDRDLTAALLAERVTALAVDTERRLAMAAAARSLAMPDAAARVLAVCRQVVQEGVHA